MAAISPNHLSKPQKAKSIVRSRLLKQGSLFAAISIALVGTSQRGLSQTAANNNPQSDATIANLVPTPASQAEPISVKIRFAAKCEQPLVVESNAVPASASITVKPASVQASVPMAAPPIAASDYVNYFKEIPNTLPAEHQLPVVPSAPQVASEMPARTVPKHLEPISSVQSSETSNNPIDVQPSRVIAFATPMVSTRQELFTAETPQTAIPPVPAAEPDRDSKSETDQTESQSAVDVQIGLVPFNDIERHESMLAQASEAPKPQPLPQPTPAETKALTAPARPQSIPPAGADGLLVPMTNSSYLPANPESYCFRCGVKCPPCGCQPGGPGWSATRPIPWEVFAQGEYVGPARLAHVPVYRLRVDDQLAFVFRLSGQVAGQPYRLNVRDRVQVQSLSAPEVINREVIVQPDGTITLPLLGQVRAAGNTMEEFSRQLDDLFKRQIKDPRITVTPIVLNSNLEELRASVDRRAGQGGQVSDARVSPDGTIQLPALGSVPAQGMTLEELEREVKTRYAQIVAGLEVTPILVARAPRFIYVVGEVRVPGRYTMEGPTTLMQAITLAGSWNVGAQLNEVIVFRRDENWQLMATKVNVRSSLIFKKPCPEGEIWLRDSDIVLIPKSPILCADDVIELVFTRGIYGVFPMTANINFSKLSSL